MCARIFRRLFFGITEDTERTEGFCCFPYSEFSDQACLHHSPNSGGSSTKPSCFIDLPLLEQWHEFRALGPFWYAGVDRDTAGHFRPRCSVVSSSLDHFPASGDVFVVGVAGVGSWRHHRCAFYPGIRAREDRFREMTMSLANRPRDHVIPREQESLD